MACDVNKIQETMKKFKISEVDAKSILNSMQKKNVTKNNIAYADNTSNINLEQKELMKNQLKANAGKKETNNTFNSAYSILEKTNTNQIVYGNKHPRDAVKVGIWTQRVSDSQASTMKNSIYDISYSKNENFGNPFSVNKNKPEGQASIDYYNWIKTNAVPEGYNKKTLNHQRNWIITNLEKVKNATHIFYNGTARGNKISHATSLIQLANERSQNIKNDDVTKSSGSSISLDAKNKTLLVPVSTPKASTSEPVAKAISEDGYDAKTEYHITAFGFPQGKELKKIFEASPEKEQIVQDLIDKADFSYQESGEIIKIQRDRTALKDFKDKSKGTVELHEEAIIEPVTADGIADFIGKVNAELGTSFPVPYPHISLAVKGTKFGIAVPTKDSLSKLEPEVISTQGSGTTTDGLIKESDTLTEDATLNLKEGRLSTIFEKFAEDDVNETIGGQSLGFQSEEFIDMQYDMMGKMDKAFNDGATGTIEYKEYETAVVDTSDTAGSIDHMSDRTAGVTMRWNKYSGSARKSEVFMHEIVHFMTNRAFQLKPELLLGLETLQAEARNAGLNYELFLRPIIAQGRAVTQSDIDIAKDKFDYVFGKSADPEEFFAYAMTNEDVYLAIKDIKVNPELIEKIDLEGREKGIAMSFDRILNVFIGLVNTVYAATVNIGGKTGAKLVTDTMTELVALQALMDKEDTAGMFDNAEQEKSYLDQMNDRLAPWTKKLDDKIEKFTDSVAKKEGTKSIGKKLGESMLFGRFVQSNLVRDIHTAVTQKTDNQKWSEIYRLYRTGKNYTEKHRKGISDALENVTEPYFDGIDEGTRKAISTVIFNLDIPSLIDMDNDIGLTEVREILKSDENANEVFEGMKEQLRELYMSKEFTVESRFGSNLNAEFESDLAQALALGKSLSDGGVHIGNQQMNAENIYNKYYLSGSGNYENKVNENRHVDLVDGKIIDLMNQMITLHGIQETSGVDKMLIYDYLGESKNRKNIKSMINMYNTYVNDAVSDLNINNFNPVQKGFFEQNNSAGMQYDIVSETDLQYYIGRFGNMVEIEEYGEINGVKYFEVTGRDHSVGFDEGMFSISGNTVPGLSLKAILTQQLTEENQKQRKRERASVDSINNLVEMQIMEYAEKGGSNTALVNGLQNQQFLPIYDAVGNIIDYHLNPTRQKKIKHMKTDTDVVKSAAFTFSKLKHRQASIAHNKEAVDLLFKYHEENLSDDNFIVLEKHTSGKFDEDVHGRWNRIPEYTRNYIFEKTGFHSIAVPKSMLTLITGEKAVSLSNFNLGPIDLRGKKKTQKMILAVENYIQEVWSWVKESIAIRMGGVVAANTVSNMMQAWVYGGINPIEYMKRARVKWKQLNSHRELTAELHEMEVELVGQGDKPQKRTLNRIKMLQARIEKNPFEQLVRDGQFSPIIEDVNVEEDNAGHIAKMIETGMNKNEFTKMVKPIKEFMFMDRNTRAYQGMLQFTQYGDIITRTIMMEFKMESAIKSGRPMTDEDVQEYLDFLDMLFVNYGYIDNRFIRYAERTFGVMFTKYLLRQAKAMHSVAIAAPARLGAVLTTEQIAGYNVVSADDDYSHLFEALGRRMDMKNPTDMFIGEDIPIFNLIPGFGDIVKSLN